MASQRDHYPPLHDLSLHDLLSAGLSPPDAHAFLQQLSRALSLAGHSSPPALWRLASKELLNPRQPHSLHRLIYNSIYKDWDHARSGPPLAWFPTQEVANESNLGKLMEAKGKELLGPLYHSPIESFAEFHKFSFDHPEIYWPLVFDEMSVHFHVPYKCIFRAPNKLRPGGTWLPGAVVNAAECCLLSKPSRGKTDLSKAIIWRNEGQNTLHSLTYGELKMRVNQVANALDALKFQKGDVFAIAMPMNTHSVIIYLAIILAGYVVVGIADSFAPPEIATRLRISNAKAIFTQDVILRGGKPITLYSRVVEAQSPMAIVIPANETDLKVTLRDNDISWSTFLNLAGNSSGSFKYEAVQQRIESHTNILFSSGTSGEPKAIPYSHLEPIRLGAEAWAHVDLKSGDVFTYPTNLGWMVGPMVLYASFLNGATLGLYNGSPLDRGFGEFVQDARVTILGTVPTIVKTWKKTDCMNGLDWSKIRIFCTTGEASNVDDDLWLSARAYYKPVLEACGGTELASAFLYGSLLQPQAFAHFTTPSMTTSLLLLNEEGKPFSDDEPCIGEIALKPMLGASHSLLNADHNKIYYDGMPTHGGVILRRHGDVFERTTGGFYKSCGRCDDTMNLGGIKTSSVEIERVCDRADKHIVETAAIAAPPRGGGPDQLVIFAVLDDVGKVELSSDYLKNTFAKTLQTHLNPYFKVSLVIIVPDLPRTATNKIMRRVLRSYVIDTQNQGNKL